MQERVDRPEEEGAAIDVRRRSELELRIEVGPVAREGRGEVVPGHGQRGARRRRRLLLGNDRLGQRQPCVDPLMLEAIEGSTHRLGRC